jgi:hypothetical protein
MKTFLAGLAMALAALGAQGQTNTSHYVSKAADMRIVEGTMYNRVLSTNWVTLPSAGGTLQVVEVSPEGIVALLTYAKSGAIEETLVIKHHPEEKKVAKGSAITTPFRAMRVADVKYGNGKVAAYDCGLANTKENRKALNSGPVKAAQPAAGGN